jgi:hypothetical protein
MKLYFFFIYCVFYDIFNKFYLSNYETKLNNELLSNNPFFYYTILNIDLFSIVVYSLFILKNCYYKTINKNFIVLALIYIKYCCNIIFDHNIKIYEYEMHRNIMWIFTTPIMLQLYCEVNNIRLMDIKIYYNTIPQIINIIIYPYKNTYIYYIFVLFTYVLVTLFILELNNKKQYQFTNIFLIIWSLFIGISIIEIVGITTIYNINIYYNLADMIGKLISSIIILEKKH